MLFYLIYDKESQYYIARSCTHTDNPIYGLKISEYKDAVSQAKLWLIDYEIHKYKMEFVGVLD